MRARATLGGVFASIVVLTIGWQAGSTTTGSTATPIPTSNGSAPTGTAGTTAPGTTTNPTDGTYTGESVTTRFGDVQVKITVAGGALTDVTPVTLPSHDSRSVRLSDRAAPILLSDVLQSQSAQVNTVSGATYTSDAYLTSLQSALDQAGL